LGELSKAEIFGTFLDENFILDLKKGEWPMAKEKCPVCASQEFYLREPNNWYEIYGLELK